MPERPLATNRKAKHDYFIEETFEAGIALTGTEVKSIRNGRVNLKDSYVSVENGELFVFNMHISPYEQGNIYNHDPLRPRKLLMHRRQINRLFGITREKGFTLIPLKLYLKNGRVKMELALAKGKKLYDKRQAIAAKTARREAERALRERNK